MDFDFSIIEQKPNKWLDLDVSYEGNGVAIFENHSGKVWGKTKVTYNEKGGHEAVMDIENFSPKKSLPLGLEQLLSNDIPVTEDGQISLSFPPSKPNPCLRLKVKTDTGCFISEDIAYVISSFSISQEEGAKHYFRFYLSKGLFKSYENQSPKFWVAPLGNFISDFSKRNELFANHPLRIFPNTQLPPNVPNEILKEATFFASQKSRLISFTFHKNHGFIEAIEDYKEKVKELENHQKTNQITAVMVCGLRGLNKNPKQIHEWFPTHYVDLLSFAIGNDVTIPWVELRDNNGQLVYRIHEKFGLAFPTYIKGMSTLNETRIPGSIGILLSKAESCKYINDSFFRTIIRHIVRGGRSQQTIDDQLDHFFRAFDTLCEYFGTSKINLMSHLNDNDKSIVNDAIQNAVKSLQVINYDAKKNNNPVKSAIINRITERIKNAPLKDSLFGLAVCDLIKLKGFYDEEVINSYIVNNLSKRGYSNWAQMLSYYRGEVIHKGFIDFSKDQDEFENVIKFSSHIHDLLARIILKDLNYEGEYEVFVQDSYQIAKTNWVIKSLDPGLLGFGTTKVKYKMYTISKHGIK